MVAEPRSWFAHVYAPLYRDLGVRAERAHVNGFHLGQMARWRAFVDAARDAGLQTVAPIYSPNDGRLGDGRFADAHWQNVRDAAWYGGGLTIDAPPAFFIQQGPVYRAFALDEIRWANRTGLHSTVIVSPHTSGASFNHDTARFLAYFERNACWPAEWVVENYEPHPKADYPNPIGREDAANTVLGVAHYLMARVPASPGRAPC